MTPSEASFFMKKYEDAVRYLDGRVNYEKKGFTGGEKFDLLGMTAALKKLGHPDRSYKSVHIAGTKGKGSASTFTACILAEAGLKVGLYTSPHLLTPRERIKINGKEISKDDFARGVFYISEKLKKGITGKLTYFELMTLLAIWYFKESKVDAAVFETGMGGRLDATNVLKPLVSGITPISYDHTHVLGRSLAKIAAEKAAIIKKGAVCVSSAQRKEALKVIKMRCKETSSALFLSGKEIKSEIKAMTPEGTLFDSVTPLRRYKNCYTSLLGDFQPENASLAAAIGEVVWRSFSRQEIKEEAVRRGIRKAFIAGRMEVFKGHPGIVIDGAQNAASVQRLACSVRKIFSYGKLVLITAFCRDKDIKGSCRVLSGLADIVIVTRASTRRAEEPIKIAGYFKGRKVIVTESAEEAVTRAMEVSTKKDLILAAGSLYLAGEIRRILKRKTE